MANVQFLEMPVEFDWNSAPLSVCTTWTRNGKRSIALHAHRVSRPVSRLGHAQAIDAVVHRLCSRCGYVNRGWQSVRRRVNGRA